MGLEKLSDIKQRLREHFQGNPKVKAWLDRELKRCESTGEPIPFGVKAIQPYFDGEPIDGGKHWRSRPTAQGKIVAKQLLELQKALDAELAKLASRRRTQTTTAKKTRKRTTASAAN